MALWFVYGASRHSTALHCLDARALAGDRLHVWCRGWRGAGAREWRSRQRDRRGDRHRGPRHRSHRHSHTYNWLTAGVRSDSNLCCHPEGQSQAGQASPPPRQPVEDSQAPRHPSRHQARADAPGGGEVAAVPGTMRGRILVCAAALSAATELSAWRGLPGGPVRAPLRHEHHRNWCPAAARRLSTSLFGRQNDGRRTAVPAALHRERHQHAHQHHRGFLPAALSAALHDRPGLPDDRLPSRPAVTAASMPHLQR